MNSYNVDEKGNRILGKMPKVIDSGIKFNGTNNILFCEDNVIIKDSDIIFDGNNSLIFLRNGEHKAKITIFNDSVCHCGQYCYNNTSLWITLSEQKHCFIGDCCISSIDVMIRNSDAHLIYDCKPGNRINRTQSVFIGDHVWLGQYVNILKGTRIDSGSIIGAGCVAAGKHIPHNTCWGGNPPKLIRKDVFWDKTCVHAFNEKDTELSKNYSKYLEEHRKDCHADYWIYEYDAMQEISWDYLDERLSKGTAEEKCRFLIQLNENKAKNRFVHKL